MGDFHHVSKSVLGAEILPVHNPPEPRAQAAVVDQPFLVGGWTNPSEKYARQNGFIFPHFRGENKKYLSCHHQVSFLLP